MLTCNKTDTHSEMEWIAIYNNSFLYQDKKEALEHLSILDWNNNIAAVFRKAMTDKNKKIQSFAINQIEPLLISADSIEIANQLIAIANDTKLNSSVRVIAISKISSFDLSGQIISLFNNLCNDSSYNVMAAALNGIANKDLSTAMKKVKILESESDNNLRGIAADFYSNYGDEFSADFMFNYIDANEDINYGDLNIINTYVKNQDNPAIFDRFTRKFYIIGSETSNKYIRMLCIQGLFNAKNKLEKINESASEKDKLNIDTILSFTNQSGKKLIELETNEDLKNYYASYYKFSK
jgi:anthranilate/para-aminobenzoate synthase component I